MAACRRNYDSRHLQADCQEPGSAPEPYARQSSMGYLYLLCIMTIARWGSKVEVIGQGQGLELGLDRMVTRSV